MICKWCGKGVITQPLSPGYCSAECNIEALEAEIVLLRDDLAWVQSMAWRMTDKLAGHTEVSDA